MLFMAIFYVAMVFMQDLCLSEGICVGEIRSRRVAEMQQLCQERAGACLSLCTSAGILYGKKFVKGQKEVQGGAAFRFCCLSAGKDTRQDLYEHPGCVLQNPATRFLARQPVHP